MDRFKVGDKVRIIKSDWAGTEATVLTPKELWGMNGWEGKHWVYSLDIQGHGHTRADGYEYAAPEDWLAPIYDGWDKCEWEDCYWTPYVTVDK